MARNAVSLTQLSMLEGMLEGMFKTEKVMPDTLFIAANNIFAHGALLEAIGLNVTDEQLAKFYDGIEMSLAALKAMSK